MASAIQVRCMSLLMIVFFAQLTDARIGPVKADYGGLLARRFLRLVETPSVILDYHNGPVLTGTNGSIPVYLIWYGNFNESDKAAIQDFFGSMRESNGVVTDVQRWWNMTGGFKDASGGVIAGSVELAGEMNVSYSLGKSINTTDIESLVLSSLSTFPSNPNAIYFVLTGADVQVEEFCQNSCASHFATTPAAGNGLQLPYAWVGNARDQCPAMCAWPFAQPSYMPAQADMPLPPNGNVGVDGMVINIAYMLAGTASNPFNNAFYQGDAAAPLEAGTACVGTFGVGSFSGYPGELRKDVITGAKFNANGMNDRKYLLPALWDPVTRMCTPLA